MDLLSLSRLSCTSQSFKVAKKDFSFLEYTLEGVLIIKKKGQDGRYIAKKVTTPCTQHGTLASGKQHSTNPIINDSPCTTTSMNGEKKVPKKSLVQLLKSKVAHSNF
jgi:hypothetical protein